MSRDWVFYGLMMFDPLIYLYLNVSPVVERRAGELVLFADSLAEDDALFEEEQVQFFSLIIAGHLGHHQRLLQEQLALRRYVALETTDMFIDLLYVLRAGEQNKSKRLLMYLGIGSTLFYASCKSWHEQAYEVLNSYFAMLVPRNNKKMFRVRNSTTFMGTTSGALRDLCICRSKQSSH